MLQMCHHAIVKHKLMMTTLLCDHHMNLPSDAVTVLMVITCVLIYVIFHTYKLLQSSMCIFCSISASIY